MMFHGGRTGAEAPRPAEESVNTAAASPLLATQFNDEQT